MTKLKSLLFFCFISLPIVTWAQRPDIDSKVLYNLDRNEPQNSGLFGLVINPAIVDLNITNLNIGAGLELFYTYKSKLGINAGYRFAYADNLLGRGYGAPSGTDERGVPVSYKKLSRLDLQAKYTVLSWEKEGEQSVVLQSGYNKAAVGMVNAKYLKAITARLGYQIDNRVIDGHESQIEFSTSTSPYNYSYNNQVYSLEPGNLKSAATMLKSNTLVFGIGYSTFRDIKITLDDDRFKRKRREDKGQIDIFLDVLYAHKMELQDMIYYHYFHPEIKHLPQQIEMNTTVLNKAGVRIGYQSINMHKPWFGTKILVELGLRPGPKVRETGGNGYLQITAGWIFGGRIS